MNSDDLIDYLNKYYLTIEQLSYKTNVSIENIQMLISNNCIPTYSHCVIFQKIFKTEIFGSTDCIENKIYYYHPCLIKLINKAEIYREKLDVLEIAEKMKLDFIKELRVALLEIEGANLRFDYCFDQNNQIIDSGIEQWMSEQWPYFIDGTYGVCLKEISAKNIVIKAVAVRQLEKWINIAEEKLSEFDKKEISRVLENYDSVASPFGPHEITQSTRGRLFNKLTSLQNVVTI